jgi:hypothetical protein
MLVIPYYVIVIMQVSQTPCGNRGGRLPWLYEAHFLPGCIGAAGCPLYAGLGPCIGLVL